MGAQPNQEKQEKDNAYEKRTHRLLLFLLILLLFYQNNKSGTIARKAGK
jgi:hypothetical protein